MRLTRIDCLALVCVESVEKGRARELRALNCEQTNMALSKPARVEGDEGGKYD